MTPTERLYYADSLLLDFEAEVLAVDRDNRVVLDQSAFYPEGGGQMSDRGTIAEIPVSHVQVDDAGVVHHVLEGAPPTVGTRVRGNVDRARRRVHMALHTGQHLLSRALTDVAGAETVSARLGESACTIDVDRAELAESLASKAESLCTELIAEDLLVRAFFPDADELARLPLRRAPKVEDRVRVVQIGDFDVTPCGGTHCLRTSQLGLMHLSRLERYKGGTPVTFEAGARARRVLVEESSLLRALGKGMSCGGAEVPGAVDKLRRELQSAREELGRARAALAERAADELLLAARERGDTTVIAFLDGASRELLAGVAARITAEPGAVAILAGSASDGMPVLVARGGQASFDCASFLRQLAAATGGRGGGKPERAEGRLPTATDFAAQARSVLEARAQ